MLQGVKLWDLKKNEDDRGFFVELMRADWDVFLEGDKIVQVNLSRSYPGVTRAWHRHSRGQIDYFVVIEGAYKLCAYDEEELELDEFIIFSDKMQIVRIPGRHWHGYTCIDTSSKILNLVTKLYDYKKPDEERRPYDSVIDPRTGEKYVW